MYPILFVFAVGTAISVERWFQLGRVRSANSKIWDVLQPVLVKGEFEKARKMVNKDKSSMAQMLGMGLARQGAVRRREDIEIAMEESMMEIIPQLEKRTPYVALLSNIATLLGLLGTIMGLDPGLHRGGQCQPGREGRSVIRQYLGSHEHHGFWPDVCDSAVTSACQADIDHGAYR